MEVKLQMDHSIYAKKPDLIINKEKDCLYFYITVHTDCRTKLKRHEKQEKYLNLFI